MRILAKLIVSAPATPGLKSLERGEPTYRVAFGAHAGRQTLALRTAAHSTPLPPPKPLRAARYWLITPAFHCMLPLCAKHSNANRWIDYVATCLAPPSLLSAASSMNAVRSLYRLKTPWRDGTTHMVFDRVDFRAYHGIECGVILI